MVLISYSGREINAKIVYYGPGLSGKTTNLEYIYAAIPQTHRGKMVSMKTKTERTLFFDFLPIDLGELAGFKTRFLLYTVPGQVYYNATRKLVLKGVDAIVFVADSKRGKMDENIESLQNLRDNLKEQGIDLDRLPWVIQYNKRDLPDIYSVEELQKALNPSRTVQHFEAIGTTGLGVFDTFKAVSRLLLKHLSREIGVRVIGPQEADAGSSETADRPKAQAAATKVVEASPSRQTVVASRAETPWSSPETPERPVETPAETPPPPPTENDVDFERGRIAPRPYPPAEPVRVPGMGNRLRRWLSRSKETEEPALSEGAPVHAEEPTPPSAAPVTSPTPPRSGRASGGERSIPSESGPNPGVENAPEPFVEPQDDEPIPVELAPAPQRPGRAPIPIPTNRGRDEKAPSRAEAARPLDGKPVVREVPVTIEIEPEELRRGIVLKLQIRSKTRKDSTSDGTGTGRARAA